VGWKDVLHPDDLARFEQRLRAPRRNQTHLAEYRLKTMDGDFRWIADSGRIVPGSHGGLRIFGAARDITERIDYEKSLIEARKRAEEIARLKSSLLSNLSHEIRTPISSIIGFAEILQDLLVDEHREFAELIEQSGQRLMEMLTALLDLTALEADALDIHPEVIDVADLTRALGERFRPQFEERGLTLEMTLPEEGPVLAFLDPDAQSRVLTNLLDNARKFTHEGRVTLTVAADADWASVSVRDTGIGISPRFLPHLFDEFVQESTGLSRQFEGNGLGLSVSKQLVERMGGAIDVESEKNRGSLFTVRYPRILSLEPATTRTPAGRALDPHASAKGTRTAAGGA
jgi:signal transduction histidine kinase